MEEERRAVKPHKYRGWDEYRVITVPRFKTSPYSGNEWRTSHSLVFYNKGEIIGRYHGYNVDGVQNIEQCFKECVLLGAETLMVGSGSICDQEGCLTPSTVTYKLKCIWSPDGKKAYNLYEEDKRPVIRKFCDKHAIRGDQGLEDTDDNYEFI